MWQSQNAEGKREHGKKRKWFGKWLAHLKKNNALVPSQSLKHSLKELLRVSFYERNLSPLWFLIFFAWANEGCPLTTSATAKSIDRLRCNSTLDSDGISVKIDNNFKTTHLSVLLGRFLQNSFEQSVISFYGCMHNNAVHIYDPGGWSTPYNADLLFLLTLLVK